MVSVSSYPLQKTIRIVIAVTKNERSAKKGYKKVYRSNTSRFSICSGGVTAHSRNPKISAGATDFPDFGMNWRFIRVTQACQRGSKNVGLTSFEFAKYLETFFGA